MFREKSPIMLIMMGRKIWMAVFLFTFCFLCPKAALAGTFNLKSIGSVDTSGRQISQWWYSGSQPVFIGEASPGASISISIDGSENTTTADSSGDWSYTAAALEDGDHQVKLSSSGSNINFTLSTGVNNVNWEAVNSDSGTETLPAAGIIWPGMLALVAGLGAIVKGGKMIRVKK